MAETKKTEYETVKMADGREVKFAGKRRLEKEYIIDEGKIQLDGDTLVIGKGAVQARFDWRDGQTRTYDVPLALVAQAAGHGIVQKGGDNLAAPADKPLSFDDQVLATDELFSDLATGSWTQKREGGGAVSGASIVVMALMERFGKSADAIKAFIEKRLADSKARDGDAALTRAALYAGYRASPELQPIIKRLEEEKAAKEASKQKIDVSGDFAALAE